ncbi:acyltransferase family protein [Mucilaginibacter sp.]
MTAELKVKQPRLLSLDVFRGASMAAMVLVNDPGDWGHIYSPLEHSKWDGCTPTDLIFPFFLFMVGVSIVYAMESKKAEIANHGQIILHAFRRMVTLMFLSWMVQLFYHPFPGTIQCIGIVVLMGALLYVNTTQKTFVWVLTLLAICGLSWFFYHTQVVTLRIPGVLQRIALTYFVCTCLYLKTSAKTIKWTFILALVGYWIIMCFIPVPGVGYANLNPETNMGAYIDRIVFTTNHLWNEAHTWDPEGLLGVLPSIGTGLFGLMVGSWLKRRDRDDSIKVTWMFVYGLLAVTASLIWDLFFPINKALWTSSFVLYTGGLATMTLATLYWLIDVQGYKKYTMFFVAFGINAITAYILSDVVPGLIALVKIGSHKTDAYSYIYQHAFVPYFTPVNASLAGGLAFTLLIFLMVWVLYKFKIIIKV